MRWLIEQGLRWGMTSALKTAFFIAIGLGIVLFPVEFFALVIIVLFFGFLLLTIAETIL